MAVTAIAAFQRTLPELDYWLLAAGRWPLAEKTERRGDTVRGKCAFVRTWDVGVDVDEKGEVGPGGESQRPNQTRMGWGKPRSNSQDGP